ncbi:MAG: hypothetical protein KC645_14480 [Gemmatimonadetes bacterium]|nr:hypothetical protein [Gemmatimonadota bacterium]
MQRNTVLPVLAASALLAVACDTPDPTGQAPDALLTATANVTAAFLTSAPAQAELLTSGTLTPLATAGDFMPGGEQLVGIPDGIGVWGNSSELNMYLNHEISGAARVSRFTIDPNALGIVDHAYTLDGSEGYSRLCSAEWVDDSDGFRGGYFFTGEEGSDGVQLAIDRNGAVTELPWLGLYAHENQISVRGFRYHTVVLNFDDNGGSGVGRAGARSELYMYVGRSSDDVLNGTGQLYVFAAKDRSLYPNDLVVNQPIEGTWVKVPAGIATDPAALEAFNDLPDVQAFPFIRLEDGFYDKRRGLGPRAYFFDTGRQNITDPDDGTPIDPWGSMYRIDYQNWKDPVKGGVTLTLIGRSDGPATGWASPDNGDMNAAGEVMLQEDPANGPWEPTAGARPPAIWKLQLNTQGELVDPIGTKIAQVSGGDCSPGASDCWETSGIVDASQWFGAGAWIFDVQAHGQAVPACPECVEDGQLLLMKLQ